MQEGTSARRDRRQLEIYDVQRGTRKGPVDVSARRRLVRGSCSEIERTDMSKLSQLARTQIAAFPEVITLVVTDDAGSLLESVGDVDGEALGAVHAATAQAITRCGNVLGLGRLERITLTGGKRACVIVHHEQELLGVYVDGARPIGAFENKLETALGR